ncbi:phenylacetic acid degradation protein [beta proteobacterium AAP121]|nr:phenylacetic acid degradation protein [beta proteobacterium AAP65]KPF97997.1 phenylacetic acid degradation protein [beta proteobacterium AAP121]
MSASTTFHPLRLAEVRPEAADALVLGFEVPPALAETFAFAPGQHLSLRATVNGEELRRSYSVCAAPGEPLRVGVRRVPGGAFSNWLHEQARVGLALDVMPPQGRFGAALAAQQAGLRHVLAVAGGSGITPLLSIVKAVLAADARTQCTLVYANRSLASMMFREELADLKNRHLTRLTLHPLFSREAVDQPLQAGHLDTERLQTLLRLSGPVDLAFVCGPLVMNDAVEAALLQAGLAAAQIHTERFGVPAAARVAAPAVPSTSTGAAVAVRVLRDGVARDIAYRTEDGDLLTAATRAGLDLPFSCRSGVCATCRAKVVAGRVAMQRNFALEPDDVQAGFVLACQAQPLDSGVVLSFDER